MRRAASKSQGWALATSPTCTLCMCTPARNRVRSSTWATTARARGWPIFVRAAELVCAQAPDIRVVVASKDPCVLETNVPVTFHLKPDATQLALLFQSCSVFVSASWAEGLGNPPLEAMACAAPVVMTETSSSRLRR